MDDDYRDYEEIKQQEIKHKSQPYIDFYQPIE